MNGAVFLIYVFNNKFDRLLKKGNVVGDGMYSWSEYKYLKKVYKDRLKVVAITASPEIRYKRLVNRKEIDEKMINRPFTVEEAKQREKLYAYASGKDIIVNVFGGLSVRSQPQIVLTKGFCEDAIKTIWSFLSQV